MGQIDVLFGYFPELTDVQREQFVRMGELYPEWNEKINVISRRDIENLYTNHVLHSLTIARFLGPLAAGTALLDLGTGGGFPGIPLAVMYPECNFLLVDRIGKKLKVADDVIANLRLTNVATKHGDVGEVREQFDYVVSRAVMPLDALVKVARPKVLAGRLEGNKYDNGIICLKGGDLEEESRGVNLPIVEFPVAEFFAEPFFETKKLVYVPMKRQTKGKH